jgi:hypothetical protein
MKIAVIADTHNRLRGRLLEALEEADEIWHLGDVCHSGFLEQFEALGKPLHVVRGNCDMEDWPLNLLLERGDTRFFLQHICPAPGEAPEQAEVVLHGHTHVPRDEVVEGVRYLNPGCVTRPNRGAPPGFAWLEFEPDGSWKWRTAQLPM